MEQKEEIRKEIRRIRAEIPKELKMQYSRQIQNNLIQDRIFQETDEIFCYLNNEDEVQTDFIINKAWMHGKKVAVPKVLRKGVMEFFYINNMDELVCGHYGILEPVSDNIAKGKHALMLIPGVAFDRNGSRIGYGGGYYDRYLINHPYSLKVALSYACQITKYIMADDNDIPVDMIFTEREIIRC